MQNKPLRRKKSAESKQKAIRNVGPSYVFISEGSTDDDPVFPNILMVRIINSSGANIHD